jgi:zinc transport system ATP-binding protein
MAGFSNRRIGELSGGQRQRAFIARALAGDADLLVLDEPTVGVDAESVQAFYGLLDALNNDGMTIVLIEHDLGAVTDHAERVVCLNRTVRFDGPTEAFLGSDALAQAFGAPVDSVAPDDGDASAADEVAADEVAADEVAAGDAPLASPADPGGDRE